LAVLHKLKEVKIEKEFMIIATDNNLDLAILEIPQYITRALDDHLLNTTNYQELTKLKALTLTERTFPHITLLHWVDDPMMESDLHSQYLKWKLCEAHNDNSIIQYNIEDCQFQ
jgi:hypothetical protein